MISLPPAAYENDTLLALPRAPLHCRTSELFDHDESKRSLAGLLAIQLHHGNANRVEIKDLQLKVLPESAPEPFDESKIAKAMKIEKPRTSRPQDKGPVTPPTKK